MGKESAWCLNLTFSSDWNGSETLKVSYCRFRRIGKQDLWAGQAIGRKEGAPSGPDAERGWLTNAGAWRLPRTLPGFHPPLGSTRRPVDGILRGQKRRDRSPCVVPCPYRRVCRFV